MTNGKTTVIAFFTRDTDYEKEADLLRASLDGRGMAHRIVPVDDRGDWYANTAQKAEFLRDCRDEMDGPLLYIDVDAYVHEDCTEYFDGLATRGVDFGAHYFAGPSKGYAFGDNCRCLSGGACSKPHRLLSGTLFLGDTEECRRLLRAWCDMNWVLREHGVAAGGGQKNLWYLTTCVKPLVVERLPGRYCYVFDKERGYPVGEPCIIEHTIASRDHRGHARQTGARAARKRELVKAVRRGYA